MAAWYGRGEGQCLVHGARYGDSGQQCYGTWDTRSQYHITTSPALHRISCPDIWLIDTFIGVQKVQCHMSQLLKTRMNKDLHMNVFTES